MKLVIRRAGQVVRTTPGALAPAAEAMTAWEQDLRDEVAERLDAGPGSIYPELLLGTAMVGFRTALDRWHEDDPSASARSHLTQALDALTPGANSLQRRARSAAHGSSPGE